MAREHRARPIDEYLPKLEELVSRWNARIHTGRLHQRLVAMGFTGGAPTTRRAVVQGNARLRTGGAAVGSFAREFLP